MLRVLILLLLRLQSSGVASAHRQTANCTGNADGVVATVRASIAATESRRTACIGVVCGRRRSAVPR